MSLVFSDVHTSYSSQIVYNTIKLIKKQCRYFSQVWILRDLGKRQKTAYRTLFENKRKELFANSVESNPTYLASWWMFRFWHFSTNLLSAKAKLLEFGTDSTLIIYPQNFPIVSIQQIIFFVSGITHVKVKSNLYFRCFKIY